MAELQELMQNCNGPFNPDLMKKFVAKHKGDSSKPEVAPNPKMTGASIFSTNTTKNTTTTTTTTGTDTTDNANIMNQKNLTDNRQTTTTTATTTTDTDNKTSTLILQNQNRVVNLNINANVNLNAKNRKGVTKTTTTSPAACPDQPDPNANMSEVAAVLEEVRGPVCEERQQLVKQVTEATVDVHLATCVNTLKAVADARARFMAMKASGQLPDMSKLSLSAGSMWEKMTDQMMPEMTKTMKFCKMLPGFCELRMEDQMKLIKTGMFEVMMTRFAMLIDHEKETMLDPSHKMVCPRQVIMEMPMGKFMDGFFHVGAQFNPIGLVDDEIAVFTAVLVFSPCRPELADSKLVSVIQSLYLQALFCLLKKNHSDPEAKMTKVLSLIPMFRRINEEHSKALGAMKMQSPDAFGKQFPPVHQQLFTPESQ